MSEGEENPIEAARQTISFHEQVQREQMHSQLMKARAARLRVNELLDALTPSQLVVLKELLAGGKASNAFHVGSIEQVLRIKHKVDPVTGDDPYAELLGEGSTPATAPEPEAPPAAPEVPMPEWFRDRVGEAREEDGRDSAEDGEER